MSIKTEFLTELPLNKLASLDITQGLIGSVLEDRSVLKVSGNDAEDYLQNQLTNDIRLVTSTHSQLSSWCTPKGRVIATFRVYKENDNFFLIMANDLLEKVMKRMQMFIMRSDVALSDVTHSMVHLGVIDVNSLLVNVLHMDTFDLESNETLSINDGVIIRSPDSTIQRYDLLISNVKLLDQLKANTAIRWLDSSEWRYFDINAGLPHVTELSSEAWIPQMLNMQIIDGVSFKKGCFPGQEVVARLKYLGKNKRRIYHLKLESSVLPKVNDEIIDADQLVAGKVLNASFNQQGSIDLLAVLKIALSDNELSLKEQSDIVLLPIALPYQATLDELEK